VAGCPKGHPQVSDGHALWRRGDGHGSSPGPWPCTTLTLTRPLARPALAPQPRPALAPALPSAPSHPLAPCPAIRLHLSPATPCWGMLGRGGSNC
ncbi:hypothetical protein, partial [Brevundimonas aurantiaca]|uniref:hypothetical protein n=1 Tax=Brevundimonas aurantiaca TaxID=74316 RepID=UPI004034932B